MVQRLFILLFISLFLTACASDTPTNNNAVNNAVGSVVKPITTDNPDTIGEPTIDTASYNSFLAASTGAKDAEDAKTVTLPSLTVQGHDKLSVSRSSEDTAWTTAHVTDAAIVISKIDTSVLSLTFDETGGMASASLYFGEKKYKNVNHTKETTNKTALSGNISENSPLSIDRRFLTQKDDTDFDFTAEHMLYVDWYDEILLLQDIELTGDAEIYEGYMIAGFRTTGTNIPRSETFTFKGAGEGATENGDYANISFYVTADVNFTDHQIELATTNTQNCNYDVATSACTFIPLSHLDFNATLKYAQQTNIISGDVETNDMVGKVDARFYGPNAEELGGTFSMSKETDEYYIGFFGAKKP